MAPGAKPCMHAAAVSVADTGHVGGSRPRPPAARSKAMRRLPILVAFAALAAMASPALSKGEIPFEKRKGWDIERAPGGAAGASCMVSKTYKDPDDDDAVNILILATADDKVVMTFIYEHWTWGKGEKIRAPLLLDKKVAIAKSTWEGDGTNMTTLVPTSIIPGMLASRKMVVKLDGADADFDLAGFPEAYESLVRCNAAPAAEAAQPALPSEARIKAYVVGAMLEAAIKECDVPTTGKQRAAFDAKIASLRPEMAPIESQVAKEVASRAEPRCPTGEKDGPKFRQGLQDFTDLSPEEFSATIERRAAAEAAAKADPKP
jgi:hypothetical protein